MSRMSSSYDSAPNDHSPQDDTQPSSKRRRIALACLDCRRRKLKCDRLFPACTRCQRGGHSDTCTYDADAIEMVASPASMEKIRTTTMHRENAIPDVNQLPKQPATPNSFVQHHGFDTDNSSIGRLQTHIYQLENRLIGLERILHGSRHWPGKSRRVDRTKDAHLNALRDPDPDVEELMMFRGSSFKTQFYGATHHTSSLSHLPVLRNFMKDMIVQHPRLAQAQKELKSMKIKGDEYDDGPLIDDKGLARLLPSKDVADQLVRIYVDNFESTYRVLHLPSFWQEYSSLWMAPEKGRLAFISLLLVMLATSYCLRGEEQSVFRGDSSLGREQAIVWIRACDSWLQAQSQKNTTYSIFQIHCVSYIAKQINSIKRKRTWTAAGALVRNAMCAGLHRDAEIVNLRHGNLADQKVSVFDQEMRRRIWATCSELELQTSFDRGMPATLRDVIVDCGPPLIINDDELSPYMEQAPKSRSNSQYTRSSFQYIMHYTWPLRQELLSLFNGRTPQLEYEEVLVYDRRIVQSIEDIPDWREDKAVVPKSLLQLQLQQLLVVLHRPYVRRERRNSRYDYSAVVHLRSAMAILDIHQKLIRAGSSVFCIFRNDVLGAALSICYNFSIAEPNPDSMLSMWSPAPGNVITYLEQALSMLEDKIMRVGVGAQEYYCICSTIGLQKKLFPTHPLSKNTPNEEALAADRVCKMIQRVLSLQDNFSAAATLASLPNMPVTAPNPSLSNGNVIATSSYTNNPNGFASMPFTDRIQDFGADLEGVNLTDLSTWDLDAFFSL